MKLRVPRVLPSVELRGFLPFVVKNMTIITFFGKNAPWAGICGMKKQKKSPKKLASPKKLTQSSKSKTTIKEDTGKLLLEAAKLVFGSICLGGVRLAKLFKKRYII